MPGRFPDIIISQIDTERLEESCKELTDALVDAFRKVQRTFGVLGMCLGYVCTVADTGSANVEFTVIHNLGVVPHGYLVAYQDKAGSVYDGGTSWTSTNIYLKASVANMNIKVLVFVSTN